MARPSAPLLSVKQAIPPLRPGFLSRARLDDLLDTAETPLTVVVAPGGWGKTSLLGAWATRLAEGGVATAWVSLDEGDDEPARFWAYVLGALIQAGPVLTSAALDALAASKDGPMAQAIPTLLNELTRTTVRHTLILDDAHVLTDRNVQEQLEFLVTHLPPTLRLVLAGRWDPPLPLARLRARGDLTEIRAADLRFSREESAQLLNTVAATTVQGSLTDAIWEQTEGWAAGVKLAGLALRGGPGELGMNLGVARRHALDFFTEEVFPSLDPAQRDLLVRAAPLEFLSGPLCDAALEISGSTEILASLERADLFTVALDRHATWFRCHRLLRDALRSQSDAPTVEEERAILLRAARWFEQQERIEEAVQHLSVAGDHAAAAALLLERQGWFLERGRASTYLSFGERLPEDAVPAQLALYLAYAAEVGGRPDRVVHWLDVCVRHTADDTVVEGWRSARAAELSLRGVIGIPASEVERTVAICEECVRLESAAGTDRHPVAMIALGRAYGMAGRLDEAIDILTGSWSLRGQGHWSTGVDLQVAEILALFLTVAGRRSEVDALLAESRPMLDAIEQDWGDAAAPMAAMLRVLEARRAYEEGDLGRAEELMARGLRLCDLAGRGLFRVVALAYKADLELARGRRANAREALVQAREVVENEPLPPFARALVEETAARVGRVAARAASESGRLIEGLTDRELSILRMLPGSASQREIGAALFISINTVKAYNKALYRKLGVSGRREAVAEARRLGLI